MEPHVRRLWIGYALVAACMIALFAVAFQTLRSAVAAKDAIIADDVEDVQAVERLRLVSETVSRKTRGYLLTKNENAAGELGPLREEFERRLGLLETRIAGTMGKGLLDEVRDAERQYGLGLRVAIAMKQRGESAEELGRYFDQQVSPLRERLDRALSALAHQQALEFEAAKREVGKQVSLAITALSVVAALTALVACLLGFFLARALALIRRQRIELEQNLERTTASNRDLDAFAGRVAHDLKGILAPLPFAAEQLKAQSEDRLRRLGERLQRVVTRTVDMSDSLLAFSRASHLSTTGESAALDGVVHDVLEDLEPLIAASDAKIELDLDRALIRCSRGLLAMVLNNLLNNALKLLVNRPERSVTLTSRSSGRWCELIVSDTGPGIPREALDRIFEPFYRLPGTRAPGTGIGLATVQRLVQAHGGRIVVNSVVDEGTSFHVWLPLAATRPAAPSTSTSTGAELRH